MKETLINVFSKVAYYMATEVGEIYQLLAFKFFFPAYIYIIFFTKPTEIRIKALYQQILIKVYTGKDFIDIIWNRMDGIITDFKTYYMENWDYILFGYALFSLTRNLIKDWIRI